MMQSLSLSHGNSGRKLLLPAWPIRRSPAAAVNSKQMGDKLSVFRRSVNRGTPFGAEP